MFPLRSPGPRDQGESLIEIIVAVVILGLAAIAITAGLTTSTKVSDVHRKQANASAYVHNYAEDIENKVASGSYAAGAASYPAFATPAGYSATMPSKQCWTGSAWTGCTAGTDIGIQKLTLQVATADGRAAEQLVVIVRYPCTNPTVASPCP